MTLIGRDKLIKHHLYRRLKNQTPFVLTGQPGVGKSALFQWSLEHYPDGKALLSAGQTISEICVAILEVLDIPSAKKKVAELKTLVLENIPPTFGVFLDDCHRATPAKIHLLSDINSRAKLFLCGHPPFRPGLIPLLWARKRITVPPIPRFERLRFARHVISQTNSHVSPLLLSRLSRGIPAKAYALARGEIFSDSLNTKEEEINIAPVFLIVTPIAMMFRYIALGTGERDVYLLAGFGMALAIVIRSLLSKLK